MTTQPELVKMDNIQNLFTQTKTILQHQKEAEILRGESFNIFSVLSMEGNENKTHSAFLKELLDPNGSHLQGTKFLELFLNTIGHEGLDVGSAKVKVEHNVGKVNLTEKTGGRIDIYIWDAHGNMVSIENKIWAKDQEAQVERYVNHKTDKNSVYYLTLHGGDPSDASKGELNSDEDFYNLSYKDDIRGWLELCQKEAADIPILRESIKQYIILIKKLTNTMDDKSAQQLQELITANYNEAKAIATNLQLVENNLYLSFFEELRVKIQTELGEDWVVSNNASVYQGWCGLSVSHTAWGGIKLGLEKASKGIKGGVHYGIVAPDYLWDRPTINKNLLEVDPFANDFISTGGWPFHKILFWLNSNEEKARLFDDGLREDFVLWVSDHLLTMAKACEEPLKNIPEVK
jgi:hypothetical protein